MKMAAGSGILMFIAFVLGGTFIWNMRLNQEMMQTGGLMNLAASTLSFTSIVSLIGLLLVINLGIFVALFNTRVIIRPIIKAMDNASHPGNGNLDIAIGVNSSGTIFSKSPMETEESWTAVVETVSAIMAISEMAPNIRGIALQADRLAKNAAIGADGAGDPISSFAMVASEARELAERSQRTAIEICNLTASSMEIAERVGLMMTKRVLDARQTTEPTRKARAANHQQNDETDIISRSIQQMNWAIQLKKVSTDFAMDMTGGNDRDWNTLESDSDACDGSELRRYNDRMDITPSDEG